MNKKADAIIIGAGVIGSAISFELAKRGYKTLNIDKDIWDDKSILCHPLINTSTLVINIRDMEKFLKITGHGTNLIDL